MAENENQPKPSATTKDCPFCLEPIKALAIKCRYCGSDLSKANAQPRPPRSRQGLVLYVATGVVSAGLLGLWLHLSHSRADAKESQEHAAAPAPDASHGETGKEPLFGPPVPPGFIRSAANKASGSEKLDKRGEARRSHQGKGLRVRESKLGEPAAAESADAHSTVAGTTDESKSPPGPASSTPAADSAADSGEAPSVPGWARFRGSEPSFSVLFPGAAKPVSYRRGPHQVRGAKLDQGDQRFAVESYPVPSGATASEAITGAWEKHPLVRTGKVLSSGWTNFQGGRLAYQGIVVGRDGFVHELRVVVGQQSLFLIEAATQEQAKGFSTLLTNAHRFFSSFQGPPE